MRDHDRRARNDWVTERSDLVDLVMLGVFAGMEAAERQRENPSLQYDARLLAILVIEKHEQEKMEGRQ